MLENISHVPLTPRVGSEAKPLSLGYFAMPVFADTLAKHHQQNYRLAIDDLTSPVGNIDQFLSNLNLLDVNWDELTRNRDIESHNKVFFFLQEGLNSGWIKQEINEVASCFNSGGCGKSEFLFLPDNKLYSQGKHKCMEDGKCNVCHKAIEVRPINSLVWYIDENQHDFAKISRKFYPEYAVTEIKDHWNKLKNSKLLISRQRATEFVCNVNDEIFFMDNDLINYLSMINLGEKSNLVLYFSGQGVLRQTLLMCLAGEQLASKENWKQPLVVTVPRINVTSSYRSEAEQDIHKYISRGISKQTLKTFLVQAFGNPAKEISLDSAAIYHINLAVKKIEKMEDNLWSTHSSDLTEEAIKVDYRNILQGLVKKIKRPDFSIKTLNEQEWFLVSVMSNRAID